MAKIDCKLSQLAERHSIVVTRYADDIVFSGRDEYIEKLSEDIDLVFFNTGLNLNKDKFFFADSGKGQRLKVHGLLVKEDRVTLTKGYRNKIRAYRHMLANGKVKESDKPRILGHIKFAEMVELE